MYDVLINEFTNSDQIEQNIYLSQTVVNVVAVVVAAVYVTPDFGTTIYRWSVRSIVSPMIRKLILDQLSPT